MGATFRVVGHIWPGYSDLAVFRREYARLVAEMPDVPEGQRQAFARITASELCRVTDQPADIHYSNRNACAVLANLGLPSDLQGEIDPQELLDRIARRRDSTLDARETLVTEQGTSFGLSAESIDERINNLKVLAEIALEVNGKVEWT